MKESGERVFRQEAIDSFLGMTSYKRAERTKKISVDRSVWSRWERGERSPSLKKMQQVASLFDLSVAELAAALLILQSRNKDQSQAA